MPAKQEAAFVIVNGDNRVVNARVFLKRETADFAASGMAMVAAKGSNETFHVMALSVVDGDVETFLREGMRG
jgi:hypothetical protein